MKHLKLFEEIEGDLWKEIDFSDYQSRELVQLPQKSKNEIISLFKLPLNSGWEVPDFRPYNSATIIYINLYSPTWCPYDWSLEIELCDDYWYIVTVDEGDIRSHYICDDIIGIKSLLQHLHILK